MTRPDPFIEFILRRALDYPDRWEVQGLGMLRIYLDSARRTRLHIWSLDFRTPGVTDIHDHPWNLSSHVIAGRINNARFDRKHFRLSFPGVEYREIGLKCGGDAMLVSEPKSITLYPRASEVIEAGEGYMQWSDEIHATAFEEGTITVVHRTLDEGADPDLAHVFVLPGAEWVDAKPRPATRHEIVHGASLALRAMGL